MNREISLNKRFIKWLAIFGVWTLFAFFFASQFALQNQLSKNPVSFWRVLSWQLFSGYVWFALMPLILRLAERFPIESGKLWRNIPLHLLFSILIALVQQAIDALVLPQLGYPPNFEFTSYAHAYKVFLMVNLHFSVGLYWAIVAISRALEYYRKYRERELRTSQLEARLAQSRLQALKAQLHPHFLFNTLNAISELVYKDAEAAERMITSLSDLLRLALEKPEVQEVTLRQELDFLQKYLEIEEMRFHDRLQVEIRVAPETLDARVPNMILQPLVENAIKHGIAPLAQGGRVRIQSERQNGNLLLQVSDNGVGLRSLGAAGLIEGVGLRNTRARLEELYASRHLFELRPEKTGGLILNLTIPYKSAAVSEK